MKRLLKWLLPTLILVEVALVWFGVLDFEKAVVIIAGIEVLIFLTGIGGIILGVRRYRKDRSSGLDFWTALEGGLAMLLPRPVARLAVAEPRIFYCLARWVLRRTEPQEGEFSYHKRSTMDMLVLLVVLVTPVEVLVIKLLLQAFLPWLWLRLLVLFLEAYALFWILGFYASRVALPHRLEKGGLRLRYGVFAEGLIPYSLIGCAEHTRRKAPEWGDGLQVSRDDAYMAINGNTDVTLELRSPLTIHGFFKPTRPVNTVHLAADEPERLLKRLRKQIVALTPTGEHPG